MAEAQLPPLDQMVQQQQEEAMAGRQKNESWAQPPPGYPRREDKTQTMEIDHALSPPQQRPVVRDFSLEDLEVARALTGLRQASPSDSIATSHTFRTFHATSSQQPPEPLLSLISSQHPFIGSAINNSVSAYNVGKSYSGPFKSSVDFVERNIASPVANTVGTAGRISGVENGVRWWLERRKSLSMGGMPMSPESSSSGHKRRRDESEADLESGQPSQRSRAPSDISTIQGEFLPAYDPTRSPSYAPRDPWPPDHKIHQNGVSGDASQQNGTWQTRLMLSTSGFGVAMSQESQRSLKYCLSWLRWANGKLGRSLYNLQTLLSEYEVAQRQAAQRSDPAQSGQTLPSQQPRDMQAISAQITALKAECVKTLQSAMDIVSKYAGGALPENARLIVRKHLTSLPQRFAFMASLQEKEEAILRRNAEARMNDPERSGTASHDDDDRAANSDGVDDRAADSRHGARHEQESVVLGARRVVVLAREGLDMMSQVSAVVDGTITSAEQWCERLGKSPQSDGRLQEPHALEQGLFEAREKGQTTPTETRAPAEQGGRTSAEHGRR